jgi:G3E family GTPase
MRAMPMNQPPLPVTVLSGFSGAGKTTLLDHLLTHGDGLRIAGIAGTEANAGKECVEMPNGCARFALSGDPSALIERIAAQQRFDVIVIESTGAADPMQIAETLTFADDEGASLSEIARLDTMVTVVDASNFMRDYASAEALAGRGIADSADSADSAEDDRTVVEVLVEQIEFCDVMVVSKTDLVSAEEVGQLRRILHAINPRAELIDARFGAVPPADVLNTGRFDFDATASAPGWLATLNADEEPDGTPDEFGVGHFVYRARRPFHPERLWTLLHHEWPGVLRSKGFFWLATRSDVGGSLSQAGGACRHGPAGVWWAAQDRSEWPTGDAELEAEIVADWYGDPDDTSIGDRRQELVLIGVDLDANEWQRKFDACLLSDEEWAAGPEAWNQMNDPFPPWDIEEHDHEHDHDHDHGDDCDCGHHAH